MGATPADIPPGTRNTADDPILPDPINSRAWIKRDETDIENPLDFLSHRITRFQL
jgi:hypothetical protein